MADGICETGCRADVRTRLSLLQSSLIVYATALVVVLVDIADGRGFHADVDDQLRGLQIRYLLSGAGHWYDLTLPFIATPEPYVSPWSRLVDLPYVLIARGASLFLAPEMALKGAFWVWPVLMLSIFSVLSAFIARRLGEALPLSRLAQGLSLVAMTFVMVIAVVEFTPGRIDHHNVQILALLLIAAGIVRWDAAGGALIGAGSAISVVVGLECLPFVVLVYGGLVACHVFGLRAARGILIAASVAMAATTLLCAGAFLGAAGALATRCDAFSAPYILLMTGFSLIIGLCVAVTPAALRPAGRALVLAVPGVALLALAAALFPACRAGPYAVIDPLSRLYWFDRIWQEHSVLYLFANQQSDVVALVALLALTLAATLPSIMEKARNRAAPWLLLYATAVVAFVLTLLLTRYVRFPAALAPLFLPAVAGWFFDPGRNGRGRTVLTAATALCLSGIVALQVLVPRFVWRFDAADYMTFDECRTADFSVLSTVPPGRIALPNGMALSVLFAAPAGFSVGAVPFHRAAPGMKRMYEAFLSGDPAVRKAALAPFDYVAVCRFPLASDPAAAPLYAALSAGGDWPGLARVAAPVETPFQLFRIDHAALR
ncbi:hypothetical protein LXM94_05150 [Rhizobium sp. TRM95111]|uniref:hypothetical protein n=1 Tax=Rhizobium alarense TaxID=2846851 RepID=UPI001F30B7B3|nr:hypothetical protein [Rhizobium alarense]MCF3639350.1 hypothetical protein [Rhizobium alarense]